VRRSGDRLLTGVLLSVLHIKLTTGKGEGLFQFEVHVLSVVFVHMKFSYLLDFNVYLLRVSLPVQENSGVCVLPNPYLLTVNELTIFLSSV
jgi:hypothetical protein